MVEGKNTIANLIQELTSPLSDTFTNSVGKWKQKSFAQKLKQMGATLLGIDVSQFEDEVYKNSTLWFHPVTEEPITPRKILQKLGTELGRDLHPDLWVNASFADYKKVKKEVDESEEYDYPYWIFTDVRFPNEANAVKERGGINIRVFRPGKLRVWFQDVGEDDEHDCSGYYYVQESGNNWIITEFADGSGSTIQGHINLHQLRFDDSDNHPSETALDNYDFDEVVINDGDIESLKEKIKSILVKHKII